MSDKEIRVKLPGTMSLTDTPEIEIVDRGSPWSTGVTYPAEVHQAVIGERNQLRAENERLRTAIQPLLEAGAPYQDEQGGCNYCGGGDWQPALEEHNDECVWLRLYLAFRVGRAEATPCEGECNHALHV